MSLPRPPLTQESLRIFALTATIFCICTDTCLAYRLVGSESLSDALVAHHYTINDRLDAVIVVDPTIPTFEYQTFYAMGHADEPEGEQGKLHFLEHIISGTGSRPTGELGELIARNGGQHHEKYFVTENMIMLFFGPKDHIIEILKKNWPDVDIHVQAVDSAIE